MKKTFLFIFLILLITVITGCSAQNAPNINTAPKPTPSASPAPLPSAEPASTPTPVAVIPQIYSISMNNFSFNPQELKIKKGDTVIWTNNDSASHTILSDSGNELGSNSLSNGEKYSHTFGSAGTFKYHCSIHPSMQGTIIVE